MKITIEYTLPTADLFRGLSWHKSRGGMLRAKADINHHRQTIYLMLLATGKLDRVKKMSEAGPIEFRPYYSRPPQSRAFDERYDVLGEQFFGLV